MAHDEDPVNFEELAHLQSMDEQIDQQRRPGASMPPGLPQPLEQSFLQELHDFYQPQAEAIHQTLDQVWGQLEQHGAVASQPLPQRSGPLTRSALRQERLHPMHDIFHTGQRWSARVASLVAVALLVVLVGGLTLGLILVRANGKSPTGSSQNQASATTSFTVTSVDLTVTPASIAGTTCGSAGTFTYTATFHIPAGTAGGTIQYEYTVNNGRSSTNASVTVSPGQTTQTATFTSSGTLPPDHTYPGVAEVLVTSPGSVHSPQVQPSGSCGAAAPPVCGSNFNDPTYYSTLPDATFQSTNVFAQVQLPPMTRVYDDDASGGVRGRVMCSAGTTASVLTFMTTHLTQLGWTKTDQHTVDCPTFASYGQPQCWKNGQYGLFMGINSSTDWVIGFRDPDLSTSQFQVTSVDMKVSPASLAGRACGTQTTVTYTATFHLAPNGPGGTVHFAYTVNNGRGSTPASIAVAAGQTTATYSFTWKGTLPADHTAPGEGGVIVTSPNQITSALVAPTGKCS